MKPAWLFVLALAALATSAPRAGPERSVEGAVTSLTEAIVANDAEAVERWLSDEWMIIDGSGGLIDRRRFLAAIRSGELVHEAMVVEAVAVRPIGGDATLWIGRARGGGRYQGDPFTFDERSTSVWARRNGRWTCLFTQLTAIARPAERRPSA